MTVRVWFVAPSTLTIYPPLRQRESMASVSANPLLTWEYYLGGPLLRFVLNKDSGSLEELSESQERVLHDLDSGGVLGAHHDPRPPVALSRVVGGQLPPRLAAATALRGERSRSYRRR